MTKYNENPKYTQSCSQFPPCLFLLLSLPSDCLTVALSRVGRALAPGVRGQYDLVCAWSPVAPQVSHTWPLR